MKTPSSVGKIDRRILVNYSADPEVVKPLVPEGLDLHLVNGRAVVGICLIRLKNIRPKFTPAFLGLTTENIAHRIAVKYENNGETRTGVYVPIRHTNSFLTSTIGTRVFSGVYKPAKFVIEERDGQYNIDAESKDKEVSISISAQETREFKSELFNSFEEASSFFECSPVGFSPDNKGCELEGIRLTAKGWNMEPLEVTQIKSSFYDDKSLFPEGSIEFDCALIMKDLPVLWTAE